MSPSNPVLVATDLSSMSLHAVDRGLQIAADTGTDCTVMHALGVDALAQWRELLGTHSAAVEQRIADEARDTLTQWIAEPARNREVSTNLHIEAGAANTAILAHADAIGAGLIVVGAHGKGFVKRLLLGSTTSRVLRKSRVPVLVVKQPCHKPYRRLLVAVDLSPASAVAIRAAQRIAPHADIVLLHVFELPYESMLHYAGVDKDAIARFERDAYQKVLRQLHELARATGLASEGYGAVVESGDAARLILQHEKQHDCDLIVMGKHGTREVEELLLGSVTKHILAESHADVLAIVDQRAPAADRQ